MLINLHIESDRNKAVTYFNKLVHDGSKIELKKIPEKRTVSQNSYVHALFALWGSFTGYTVNEAKMTVKRHLGYTYQKNGEEFFVQTSMMDTKELSEFVDKFRNWSASEGYYLPSSNEFNLRNFDYSQEIQRAEIMEKRYGYT